ncbi:Uncharacterised protein [Bordetella pertussis]|nr:Uncharacterised protein [Bordetella pertussis]CFO74874.1 Uncharacterised protein [Bordetella pertussis]CFU89008.1 Uncharacterised protein [Bordetella pertussis]CFW38880.1 Uncharacterised protein [Bordetella pertussis]CPI87385.1 Uncharacterised protein [Bordetella pertussis]
MAWTVASSLALTSASSLASLALTRSDRLAPDTVLPSMRA